MIDTDDKDAGFLISTVLHELATEAESLLLVAQAVEDRATGFASNAHPEKLREAAALVKISALHLVMAAANLVGTAERLRLVAEFVEVDDPRDGQPPS